MQQEDDPDQSTETIEDGASDASSSGFPPPLISGDEYECFVCGHCVSKNATLRGYAGSPGIMMVVRDDLDSPWRRLGDERPAADESIDVATSSGVSTVGSKRAHSPSDSSSPNPKRARGTSQASTRSSCLCLAPKPNSLAQNIIANRDTVPETSLGTGDVFLKENFRDHWCRCASVGILV
jgi:E3 ubiquitin-protein ligase UBR7